MESNITKEILSTGDLAEICHVTKHTIIAAIDRGELRASRTPGGHNRIRRDDALEFMRRYNFLPQSKEKKILVVDGEGFVSDIIEQIFDGEGYSVISTNTVYKTACKIECERPDLIVLDDSLAGVDTREVRNHIEGSDYGKKSKILLVISVKDIANTEKNGIQEYITKPFSIEKLKEKLEVLIKD